MEQLFFKILIYHIFLSSEGYIIQKCNGWANIAYCILKTSQFEHILETSTYWTQVHIGHKYILDTSTYWTQAYIGDLRNTDTNTFVNV